jgi:ABC-2 type transport system permease protein
MNTQSNAIPESHLKTQVVVPVFLPETRLLYWSVARELWENRSIYIAPLAVAALFLFGFAISMIHLPAAIRAGLASSSLHQQELIQQPYNFVALLLMGTTLVVGIFYCLDALHGERRDRSILFWKSLPVSDLTTVLSKASIPVVVLPLLTFTITAVTQWIMLLLSTMVLLGSGVNVATLWTQVPLLQMWLMLLYHLVIVHGLYYAPIFGWLLLVSGWARRAPFLWAGLPLLAIAGVEKIAFNTSHFGQMLGSRLSGGPGAVPYPMPAGASMESMAHLGLLSSLSSPGLWIGLAVTAAFLAAAVRLRRYQGPI